MAKLSIGCIPFLIVGGILCLFAGWTETNLEFWLTMIKGASVDVPYWIALLLTIFTNVFGLVFNILTELAKLVLV
jgi:hypothetical protein